MAPTPERPPCVICGGEPIAPFQSFGLCHDHVGTGTPTEKTCMVCAGDVVMTCKDGRKFCQLHIPLAFVRVKPS